jgi:hypothetical protein
MKTLLTALALVLLGVPAFAGDSGDCSARQLAGRWMFATDISHRIDVPEQFTAIGTFQVDRAGKLRGKFDLTLGGTVFLPAIGFFGQFTVNPDCTGTVFIQPDLGQTRTDSIVLLGDRIRGMSQDINFLIVSDFERIGRR